MIASPLTSTKPVTSIEQPRPKRMRMMTPDQLLNQSLPLSALLPSQVDVGDKLFNTIENETLLEAALWQDAQAGSLLNPTSVCNTRTLSMQEVLKSDSFRDECTVMPNSVWTPLFGTTTAQIDNGVTACEHAIAGELLAFPDVPSTALLDGFLHCAAEDALLSSWADTMLA